MSLDEQFNVRRIQAVDEDALESELHPKMIGFETNTHQIAFKTSVGDMHWFTPKYGWASYAALKLTSMIPFEDSYLGIDSNSDVKIMPMPISGHLTQVDLGYSTEYHEQTNKAALGDGAIDFSGYSATDNTGATGQESFTLGKGTTASGLRSIAVGLNNTSSTDYSISAGSNCIANHLYSAVHGFYTRSSRTGSANFGMFNDNTIDGIFQVGNGASDTVRSNAIDVNLNGIVVLDTPTTKRSIADITSGGSKELTSKEWVLNSSSWNLQDTLINGNISDQGIQLRGDFADGAKNTVNVSYNDIHFVDGGWDVPTRLSVDGLFLWQQGNGCSIKAINGGVEYIVGGGSGHLFNGYIQATGKYGLDNVEERIVQLWHLDLYFKSDAYGSDNQIVVRDGDNTQDLKNTGLFYHDGSGFYGLRSGDISGIGLTTKNSATININDLGTESNKEFNVISGSSTTLFNLKADNGVASLPNCVMGEITHPKDILTKEYGDANYNGGGTTSPVRTYVTWGFLGYLNADELLNYGMTATTSADALSGYVVIRDCTITALSWDITRTGTDSQETRYRINGGSWLDLNTSTASNRGNEVLSSPKAISSGDYVEFSYTGQIESVIAITVELTED